MNMKMRNKYFLSSEFTQMCKGTISGRYGSRPDIERYSISNIIFVPIKKMCVYFKLCLYQILAILYHIEREKSDVNFEKMKSEH